MAVENGADRRLSPTRTLLCDLVVLAALATMFLRPHFPSWMKPEWYGFRHGLSPPFSASAGGAVSRPAELQASQADQLPVLVVGDSSMEACPWPVDRLGQPGLTVDALAGLLAEFLETSARSYDQIVLWPGTWDMMQRRPTAEFVAGARRLVCVARDHTGNILLVGPMPPPTSGRMSGAQRAHVNAVAAAVALLRLELPDVPLYDMAEFRRNPHHGPGGQVLYLDALHINRAGFWSLAARLKENGMPVAGLAISADSPSLGVAGGGGRRRRG